MKSETEEEAVRSGVQTVNTVPAMANLFPGQHVKGGYVNYRLMIIYWENLGDDRMECRAGFSMN